MKLSRAVRSCIVALVAGIGCADDEPRGPLDGGGVEIRDVRPLNATCLAHARPRTHVPAMLEPVFPSVELKAPMMLAQIPGDDSRWFVAERGTLNGDVARIVAFSTAAPHTATVVGTVGPLHYVTDGEGGLLGLAFHPSFADNGRLYVTWTTSGSKGGRSVVGYLTSTDGGSSFGSYTEILSFDQPFSSHKGGGIAFGMDGLLHLAFGDGVYPADAMDATQRNDTMFGKVLRIDVDHVPPGATYGIPADNPFAAGGGEPAVFAWGFRNPVRLSVDRATGDIWVGDVGDALREEINLVRRGENYGWPCLEGTLDLLIDDPVKCPTKTGFTPPVLEQHHDGASRSITGGVVYRGKAIPELVGTYIFGDFVTQEVFGLARDGSGTPTVIKLNEAGPSGAWMNFAEDADGEVYALSFAGHAIYKLVPSVRSSVDVPGPPERLSMTGCVDPADPKRPAAGLVPYSVNAELWSDGATKERWLAIPDGASISVDDDGHLELPIGSVTMKTFSLDDRRVETRLMMRHADGDWAGYTYAWNADETDAVLANGTASETMTVGEHRWTLPSRSDCLRCHTVAAKRSLGLELRQLDRDFPVADPTRTANQVDWLTNVGMLERAGGAKREPLPDPLGSAPLELRARAYLHANCAGCHRPGGGGRGSSDLRFTTPLHEAGICNALTEAQVGPITRLIVPGAPDQSMLSMRTRAPAGYFRMPPLGTTVVDEAGIGMLDAWIASLSSCP